MSQLGTPEAYFIKKSNEQHKYKIYKKKICFTLKITLKNTHAKNNYCFKKTYGASETNIISKSLFEHSFDNKA